MSQRRGGTQPDHGVRQLARQVERKRLDPRTRRQLSKLHRALAAEPIDAVRAHLIGRIARKEMLCQRAELALLADGDLGQATGLGKFSTWLWNSWRRDVELLTLLEERASRDQTPSLADYLQQRAANAQAAPKANAAQPVDAQPVVDNDAAGAAPDAPETKS
jgi:hypothetical protein